MSIETHAGGGSDTRISTDRGQVRLRGPLSSLSRIAANCPGASASGAFSEAA